MLPLNSSDPHETKPLDYAGPDALRQTRAVQVYCVAAVFCVIAGVTLFAALVAAGVDFHSARGYARWRWWENDAIVLFVLTSAASGIVSLLVLWRAEAIAPVLARRWVRAMRAIDVIAILAAVALMVAAAR